MHKYSSGGPRSFEELPRDIQAVCITLLEGLKAALSENLYGIYLYGAMVFPETKHILDIDFHAIVKRPLTVRETDEIQHLYKELAEKFPPLGAELDGRYILLDDARQVSPPKLQMFHPELFDDSWTLHRAHIRAGYCIVLYGPEPEQVFPAPTWSELLAGLEVERMYIERHLSVYPDYCVLNLCRLLYSYRSKNVVISKQTAAEWVLDNFTTWKPLVEAALRSYAGEMREEDKRLLESETERFYQFACDIIEEMNRD
jgi:hypothetical protein